MSSDTRRLVEQIAAEADATRDEPMPAEATATRPDRSVPVAVRLAPEDNKPCSGIVPHALARKGKASPESGNAP